MGQLNILMVDAIYSLGGSSRVVSELSEKLTELGHSVSIRAFLMEEPYPKIDRCNVSKLDLNLMRVARTLKQERFDLIHAHSPTTIILKKLTGLPMVYHFHGSPMRSSYPSTYTTLISLKMLSRAPNYVVSVSNYASSWLEENFGVSSEVIYNGIDTKVFRPDIEKKFRQGNPQLLFVGNLYEHKGVLELLEAVHGLRRICPELHMSIVGDGPLREEIARFSERMKLTDVVSLEGRVPERLLPYYYASCDVYVTASRYETYGIPLIEAMSSGKPFVASSIPAHVELAKASSAGLVYHVGNVKELSERIAQVSENREKYEKSALRFAADHDWASITRRMIEIYNSVLH